MELAYPKDTDARIIGSKARSIVHYKINPEFWEYKEETGCDFGRDCIIEYIDNKRWKNQKIEGQIKGTKSIKIIINKKMISQQIEIKTLLYAINSPIAFVLFVVDVENEKIYYQCLQDYYYKNKEIIDKRIKKQKYINIRIPIEKLLSKDSNELIELAKRKIIY